jgi:hypothetical protein
MVKHMVSAKFLNQFIATTGGHGIEGHRTDGLVFHPEEPVRMGTHTSLFKWKPCHSIDFWTEFVELVNDTEVLCKLYAQEGGMDSREIVCMFETRFRIDIFATIGLEDVAAEINRIPAPEEPYGNKRLIEYRSGSGGWIPMILRKDKDTANSVRTVQRTMRNIEENIQIDDLLRASVRQAQPTDNRKPTLKRCRIK